MLGTSLDGLAMSSTYVQDTPAAPDERLIAGCPAGPPESPPVEPGELTVVSTKPAPSVTVIGLGSGLPALAGATVPPMKTAVPTAAIARR